MQLSVPYFTFRIITALCCQAAGVSQFHCLPNNGNAANHITLYDVGDDTFTYLFSHQSVMHHVQS